MCATYIQHDPSSFSSTAVYLLFDDIGAKNADGKASSPRLTRKRSNVYLRDYVEWGLYRYNRATRSR